MARHGHSFRSLASGMRRFQVEDGEETELTQVQVAAQPNAGLARVPGRVLRCSPSRESPSHKPATVWRAVLPPALLQ